MLKTEKEKSEKTLKKVMTLAEIRAQAQRLAEYEAKRAKMLKEYNHCITHRADPSPISKIIYRINNTSKEATKRITRNNDPLNLIVYDNFRLKMLGFSEWVKVHALASKTKSKSNDVLLKNLRPKFQWVSTEAEKLGIPPPPELTAFGIFAAKKKRKRSSKIIKKVFVNEDIVVDGMHRNFTPPPGVVTSRGLVISDPESGIRGTPEAEEMFKKIKLAIEARNDVAEARNIVKENLDEIRLSIEGLAECKASTSNEDSLSAKHRRAVKGLAECKASTSNLRRIQVKDIVKEVEDYLKTYSSPGTYIS
ncbi:hypothetical protein Tco_0967811 [Tanacetum coccineum]